MFLLVHTQFSFNITAKKPGSYPSPHLYNLQISIELFGLQPWAPAATSKRRRLTPHPESSILSSIYNLIYIYFALSWKTRKWWCFDFGNWWRVFFCLITRHRNFSIGHWQGLFFLLVSLKMAVAIAFFTPEL